MFLLFVHCHFPVLCIRRRLYVKRIRSIITVPQQQPQRSNVVRLTQLYQNFAAAQLMARIARIPIISSRVAVEEIVSGSADAFYHRRTHFHGGHIFGWWNDSIDQRRKGFGVFSIEWNDMKNLCKRSICVNFSLHADRFDCPYLIFGVMRSNKFDVTHSLSRKIQILPRTAIMFVVVHDAIPLLLVNWHLNEIRIRAIVFVPEQYFDVIDDADGAQFDNNARVVAVGNRVTCVSCRKMSTFLNSFTQNTQNVSILYLSPCHMNCDCHPKVPVGIRPKWFSNRIGEPPHSPRALCVCEI